MTDCPFCDRIERGDYIRTHDMRVIALEPLNPVTEGHLLFVGWEHIPRFQDAVGRLADCMAEAAIWAADLPAANLIVSSGAAATQTIQHMHVHLVPRTPDDGLTLPWTGQQKTEAPA